MNNSIVLKHFFFKSTIIHYHLPTFLSIPGTDICIPDFNVLIKAFPLSVFLPSVMSIQLLVIISSSLM